MINIVELDGLAAYLRSRPALRAKSEIRLVSEVLGGSSWVHGPGDDGAVVPIQRQHAPGGGQLFVRFSCQHSVGHCPLATHVPQLYGEGPPRTLSHIKEMVDHLGSL